MAKIYSTVEVCMSDYAAMTYEEKVSLSRNAYNLIKRYYGEYLEDFANIMLVFMGVLILCGDWGIKRKGIDLMSELFPYERIVLEKYIEKSSSFSRNYTLYEKVKRNIKSFPRHLQEEMLTMALCFLTIDGSWADYQRKNILEQLFDLDDYFESLHRSFSD